MARMNSDLLCITRWFEMLSPQERDELINKYKLSPGVKLVVYDSDEYWNYNAEATELIYNICLLDGPDITSVNFNNAMRYFWVIMNSKKYRLDIVHARDDNNIKELAEMYKDADGIV